MILDIDDIERFLERHWQKDSRFMPGVLPADLPQLSPDEIAWLATQPDVEARLVYTDRERNLVRYRVETGPFDETVLSKLPGRDWTLLVQDVEKHLPDFRSYLTSVPFVPDWRIDDLMVSCAAPGGSVGPHVDNYDVFLCQGMGKREWTTGSMGRFEIDDDTEGLALVRPFSAAARHLAAPGDVLYLPPGIPHWGIANELCTTYSIGCRAPTRRELELGQERVLGKTVDASGEDDQTEFYSDADLSPAEAIPGAITMAAIHRLREQRLLDLSLDDTDLARILGCVVTDPKAWLAPDADDDDAFDRRLETNRRIRVHGMAHLAWIEFAEQRRVFVNGVDREIDPEGLRLVRKLCADRHLSLPAEVPVAQRELLSWMAREGLFDSSHSQE